MVYRRRHGILHEIYSFIHEKYRETSIGTIIIYKFKNCDIVLTLKLINDD
jgi:hypothetical protein